mmetsp:Transcript_42396/g.65060  ORF Transcript_42396/g.65060 Transcript_42396/m.65060 type:complete len:84 (+) Transcript_42396:353-604(+)
MINTHLSDDLNMGGGMNPIIMQPQLSNGTTPNLSSNNPEIGGHSKVLSAVTQPLQDLAMNEYNQRVQLSGRDSSNNNPSGAYN